MMSPAVQSCDPAAHGRTFNTTGLAIANGAVALEVRWTWDGTSIFPACDGPLVNGSGAGNAWAIRAINTSNVPYYAHTIRKNNQPATYTLNPGQTVDITAAQAAANGYTVISDFYDITLTTTP
jgi:hypothetical protein